MAALDAQPERPLRTRGAMKAGPKGQDEFEPDTRGTGTKECLHTVDETTDHGEPRSESKEALSLVESLGAAAPALGPRLVAERIEGARGKDTGSG